MMPRLRRFAMRRATAVRDRCTCFDNSIVDTSAFSASAETIATS
jgi:hypothetical protein